MDRHLDGRDAVERVLVATVQRLRLVASTSDVVLSFLAIGNPLEVTKHACEAWRKLRIIVLP